MARDATATRERLLRAGEHVFARHGVSGASLRDVNAAAGQRNNSALHYHFGSRDGLLRAIFERHQAAIDEGRVALLRRSPPRDLRSIVTTWFQPMAAELATESGRDYLRILPELVDRLGEVQGLSTAGGRGVPLGLPGLAEVFDLVRNTLTDLPAPLVRARLVEASHFLAASLAARARAIDAGATPALGARRYEQNVVAMVTGALEAPIPADR
jgi:AcrR family transcriptional regulator